MEELEVPTEHLHETINEKAAEEKEKWSMYIALSTAVMAVFAAISGLLGGHYANEALIGQVKASDQWAYYQSKSIKAEIAASTGTIISIVSGKTLPAEDVAKSAKYEKDKEEIKQKAQELDKESELCLNKHNVLARAVTMFQIAIALAAISILTKKRLLWVCGIVLSLIGIFFLLQGSLLT